ncbi:FmdB family zinc ribbon protein [Micrococcus lacusdianchii]|uniref:FmdB family zinc ribbon protein n=1 Tax=Micrococcus lacusdianchii TaxID=2915940 RepID=UPI0020064301|nr:FmdB family zinc ribbon protein [Micrococcus sp. JXJ CY 30]
MPTYAYRCKDCGHAFDAVQSFSDDALTECPACGGVLRKQYGSVGVSFKGSGFYRTDSRGGTGGGDGAKASSGGAASGSDSGSAATTTSGGGSAD